MKQRYLIKLLSSLTLTFAPMLTKAIISPNHLKKLNLFCLLLLQSLPIRAMGFTLITFGRSHLQSPTKIAKKSNDEIICLSKSFDKKPTARKLMVSATYHVFSALLALSITNSARIMPRSAKLSKIPDCAFLPTKSTKN